MELLEKFLGSFSPALTYSDVVVLPGYLKKGSKKDISTVLCKDRDGHDFVLKKPLISAAMDTVTEADMSIKMAREGGLGVIHINLTPEEQARQVKKVKRAENLMIATPVFVNGKATIGETAKLIKQQGFSSIPVLDDNRKILGLAINPSVRFQQKNYHKPITTTMGRNPIKIKLSEVQNEAGEIDLEKAKNIFAENTQKISKALLIEDDNGVLKGLITSKDVENLKTFPNASKDSKGRLRVAAAISTAKDTMKRVRLLVAAEVDLLVIDSSHGHSDFVVETIKAIKKEFPDMPVVAGNVVTKKGALFLAKAGADIIKVGVGPGAICSTRKISGVGLPQFSAILDVCEALKEEYSHIAVIADGGIKHTGDIGKAIVAGAKAVMMGSALAGTDEAPGETILHKGMRVKIYRGMGSIDAQRAGAGNRYEQDGKTLISHGVVSYVPYKGAVTDILDQCAGGLGETMTLTGAENLAELQKAEWRQITTAGEIESHPHGVQLVHEEPNYKN
ncbi:IMP dehydrogenase [Patescibacteria group bacterium]|nr:IMP dehydrogenase [Patescibacteria group bacterium]MBU1758128.1 IMP dehydrogenase [Patescibacteria group bacterium]